MGTPADTLVSKHNTRIEQLRGPVLQYLKMRTKNLPFNGTEQDLYMSVFHPASRRIPANTLFPAKVRKDNPGISTPKDYVRFVNSVKRKPELSVSEQVTLEDTASAVGTTADALYNLINFESGWNPAARNRISGARGLIQFMPSTAKSMGYKGTLNFLSITLLLGVLYYGIRKLKLL